MGISSSKSTNKPIYDKQITGAGNTLAGVYGEQAPKIAGYADQIGSLIPGLAEKSQQGDPAVNAASKYITDTLGADPTQNPYLDQVVAQGANDTRNASEAALGLKGLTGGSSYADIISRNVNSGALATRYADYNDEMNRKAEAAGMAPSIAAGGTVPITALLSTAGAASGLPLDAATQYASGIGGLLGQYQKTKTTQPWGPALLSGLGQAAGAVATGGGSLGLGSLGGLLGGGGVTPDLTSFAGYKF